MKLYIYDHCPFCARVAYIAQSLELNIELVSVDYDDAQTLIDLIGKKMVPVLQKDDGSIMAESLDIIAYFMNLKSSDAWPHVQAIKVKKTITILFDKYACFWKDAITNWWNRYAKK